MTDCTEQPRVAAAARTNRWTEALRDHRDRCGACAETALVTAALVREVELDSDPLPDPRRVWLIARQRSRHQAARRVMWPITLAHRAAWIAAAAVAIAWGPKLFDLLRGGVSTVLSTHASSTILEATTSPAAVVVATALFLAGLVAVEAAVRDSR